MNMNVREIWLFFLLLCFYIPTSVSAQYGVVMSKDVEGKDVPVYAFNIVEDSVFFEENDGVMLYESYDGKKEKIEIPSVSKVIFRKKNTFTTDAPSYVYGVSEWPFGKSQALCFTWDDGINKQMPVLMDVFNQNGYKTTFAVPTANFKKAAGHYYHEAHEEGHEIASHTVHHAVLTLVSVDSAKYEIEQSAKDIKAELGFVPVTFCHPERAFNTMVDSIVLKNYYTSRFSSILRYPNRKVHSVRSIDTYESLVKELDEFMQTKNKWMVYSGHGLSSLALGDKGVYQPIDSTAFDSYLKYIRKNYDVSIYVDTYDNVVFAELLRDNVVLEYGDNVIHLNAVKVLPMLEVYHRPSAYITLLLDPMICEVIPSKEVIDKRVVDGKLCVTVDLRKGDNVYLRK